MTPKEKARELIKKFYPISVSRLASGRLKYAKQCALIAVDEIMKANLKTGIDTDKMTIEYNYWREVKQEIEKL